MKKEIAKRKAEVEKQIYVLKKEYEKIHSGLLNAKNKFPKSNTQKEANLLRRLNILDEIKILQDKLKEIV